MHAALARADAGERHALRVTTACLGRELRALEEEDIHELQQLLHQQRSRGAHISPYISQRSRGARLASDPPYTPPCLPISPYASRYLPMPPYISP